MGSYPGDVSPYGCHDMVGNVHEWVQDWYRSYPGSTSPFDYTGTYRVLRGGGWNVEGNSFRCAYRGFNTPGFYGGPYGFWSLVGFRLAR